MSNARFAARSDVGRNRDLNEDGFLAQKNAFAVADGMGGHQAGEIASDLALKIALRCINKDGSPAERIRQAFNIANRQIIRRANRNVGQYGMGTTLTLALITGRTLWIGHIGDSRAYLYNRGKLKQLTEDHTLVARLLKEGEIDVADANDHPKRHVITKAIGSHQIAEPDIFSLKINLGDRLLLCTDGLTSMLNDEEISAVIGIPNLDEAAGELVARANAKGGYDNVTVVVVDIDRYSDDAVSKPWWRRWRLRVAVLLSIITLSVLAVLWAMNNVHFLGKYRQKVAVYRGLPVEVGDYKFYRLVRESNISVDKLPNYYRQRVNAGIIVGSRKRADMTLKDIESFESK